MCQWNHLAFFCETPTLISGLILSKRLRFEIIFADSFLSHDLVRSFSFYKVCCFFAIAWQLLQSWDFPEEVSHQIVQVMRQLIVVFFGSFLFIVFFFVFFCLPRGDDQNYWANVIIERRTRIATGIMCTIGGLGRYIGRYIDRYIGRLSTDYRPIAGRQSADSPPTVDRLTTDSPPICRSTVGRRIGRYVAINCRSTIGQVSVKCRPNVGQVSV